MKKVSPEHVVDLNADSSSPHYLFPLDWGTDKHFLGVSRAASVRRYVVRLSACGKQFALGTTTSQVKAAKLYDWANWKLAAFLRKPQFNFPESFATLIEADCPQSLLKVYAECERLRPLSGDLTEREHREAAFQRLLDGTTSEVKRDQSSAYQRCMRAATRISGNILRDRARLVELHRKLKLLKLPELSRQLTDLEALLQKTTDDALAVAYALESHEALYKSQQESAQ